MSNVAVLGKFEVIEDGSRGSNTASHLLYAETLEILGVKLSAQLLAVDILREYPLFESVGVETISERGSKAILITSLVDNLLGCEI